MKLSIVTTLYNSSLHVDEFYQRISLAAKEITDKYEIVFVDDGSPDDSLLKALSHHKRDDHIKVIELSKNFGHHRAIMTGLSNAKGDYVFLIDSDLEEEPELLNKFWNELHKEDNIDVVYGIQENRKGALFEKLSGRVFYKVYNYISDVKIPANLVTARLFTKQAKDALVAYSERELCFGCVCHDIGYKQVPIKVNKLSLSKSTYNLKQKIAMAANSLVSFSSKPLVSIFLFGLIITFLSLLFSLKLIIFKLLFDQTVDGWTSVIVSIFFFGGLIIFILGIIGVYLSKIFIEVKQRPYSIIKNFWEGQNHD
ncbi:MAG: glycosyltransferase family 2 protein [archaeon]|nr:glycosyltransferase family 2 protein [archaeon]